MKFILVLLINCFFVVYSILYLTDHPFTRASLFGKIKQVILLGLGLYVIYNLLFIYLLKKEKEETGLIYKIISFGEKAGHASMNFIQPIQKELIISMVIAFVLIALGLLFAGLPGGALLGLLQKIGLFTRVRGDGAWPAAIMLSIVLPLCIPFAVLAKHFLLLRGYEGFAGLRILLGLVWVIIIIPLVALISSTSKS